MDVTVGGEDLVRQVFGVAGEVGDGAAGFLHDEHPGGDVVDVQVQFPAAVGAAAGDIAQVHRRRAEDAQAAQPGRDAFDQRQVVAFEIGAQAGKAGGHEAIGKGGAVRDGDGLAVARGAVAFFG